MICAWIERASAPSPRALPVRSVQYARALWFEKYGDTALAQIIGAKIFFQKVVGPMFFNHKTDEAVVKKATEEELPPLFDYLEGQLAGSSTLAGKLILHRRYHGIGTPVRQSAPRRFRNRRAALAKKLASYARRPRASVFRARSPKGGSFGR